MWGLLRSSYTFLRHRPTPFIILSWSTLSQDIRSYCGEYPDIALELKLSSVSIALSLTMEKKMIHRMFHIGFVVSLMALASPAVLASNWHVAWVGNDETRFYFDADSVEKLKDSVAVWVKTVQVNKAKTDGSWANALRWRFNCTRKTIQALAISLYDKNGEFLRSIPGSSNDTIVTPDSTGEAMLKIVCKANFPNNKSGSDYLKLDGSDVFQATKNYADEINSKTDSAPK